MTRRWMARSLVVLAVVSAGCSSTEGGGGDGEATDGEPVTLTLWAFEGEEEFFPTLIDRFETEYPNVTIKMTEIPEDNYATKMDTALAAGRPPDLGLVYEPRWLKAGAVQSLDEPIGYCG